MLAVGVVLSGCGAGEPQRPPAPVTASPEAAVADPTPAVPEYTTKLKLTAKEKQAADGAVLTVERYFKALTKIYQDPSSDPEPLKSLSGRDIHYLTMNTISGMQSEKTKMEGEFQFHSISVDSVNADNNTSKKVSLTGCSPNEGLHTINSQGQIISSGKGSEKITMYMNTVDSHFVVDNMEPVGAAC
ncbi:hypothetical protein NQ038_07530 [Brevibacterium sp. 50QC2O2]|uniref:hypothetical protein n=1 Tax=Brevibacterium sp. 50QC2O2 TaxID=2968459 RepID=UPI00211B8B5E|nr:hypothetical protein [Brevibacterium sp. 50QC2O2]MCQ9388496.1 hypothetical protein [Brevibacterium sp. 50QC2O2]